jgi:GDPmannose 4,6-dehydratase
MAKALILGINGQDGSYLAEILLDKGYEVHGMVRRTATGNLRNIQHIEDRLQLHIGDLTDPVSLHQIVAEVRPQEIYNEADQDHAGLSFKIPAYNFEVTGAAVGRLLEIIRQVDPTIRFFQPVTSNMFGQATEPQQNEDTRLNPINPYSCAKVFAYYLCHMYRQTYGMHVSMAIFYNHESPRRTEHYVTRKITRSIARIKAGLQDKLVLAARSMRCRSSWNKPSLMPGSILYPTCNQVRACSAQTPTAFSEPTSARREKPLAFLRG